MSAEHEQLSAVLAESFDNKSARRAGELASVVEALREWEAAQAALAELRTLQTSQDAELREMANEELESTHAQLSAVSRRLSEALTPKDSFSHLPCLIEIRPGPGGLEGRFFADTVFKMYRQYCIRHGLRASVIKYDMADAAGDSTTAAGEMPPTRSHH